MIISEKRAETGIIVGLMTKPILVLIHLGPDGQEKRRKGERRMKGAEPRFLATP